MSRARGREGAERAKERERASASEGGRELQPASRTKTHKHPSKLKPNQVAT